MKSEIKHVGILGGGKMGFSLFNYLSGRGFDLSLYQRSNPEKLLRKHQRKLSRQLKNGIITEPAYHHLTEHQQITSELEIIAKADLVVECLAEDLHIKNRLLRDADRIAPPDALFATNSSSILPAEFHVSEERKPLFVGMHFFYPVETQGFVELISSTDTAEKVLTLATSFLRGIGKQVLFQDSENAFLVNRALLDLQAAAFNLSVAQKLPLESIDRALRNSFMSLGVFEMMDHIGLDVLHTSINNYLRGHDDIDKYGPLRNQLAQMNKKMHLGIKTGKGFYYYNDKSDSATTSNDPAITLQGIADDLEEVLRLSIHRYADHSGIDKKDLEKAVFEIL